MGCFICSVGVFPAKSLILAQNSDDRSEVIGIVTLEIAGRVSPQLVKCRNVVRDEGTSRQGSLHGGEAKGLVARSCCINRRVGKQSAYLLGRLRTFQLPLL